MDTDVKRQKVVSAPPKLFDVAGNSSLGSLPRGEIVVRKDFIMMTSVDSEKNFLIGARPRTSEISSNALLKGMDRIKEQSAGILASKGVKVSGVQTKSGSLASFTPDAPLPSDVVTEPVQLDPDQDAGAAFVTKEGLTNPSNRIV